MTGSITFSLVSAVTSANGLSLTAGTLSFSAAFVPLVKTGSAIVASNTISATPRGANAVDIQPGTTNTAQIASGAESVAIGYQNTASGIAAVSIGFQNTAGAEGVAIGAGCVAGITGIAIGVASNSSGSMTFAASGGVASGSNSIAIGTGCVAAQNYAMAAGNGAVTSNSGEWAYGIISSVNTQTGFIGFAVQIGGSTDVATNLNFPEGYVWGITVEVIGATSQFGDFSASTHVLTGVVGKSFSGSLTVAMNSDTTVASVNSGVSFSVAVTASDPQIVVDITNLTTGTINCAVKVEYTQIAIP